MKREQDTGERLGALLGMARRAGRLTTGFDAVTALIAAGQSIVVMVAANLSKKTEKELRFAARNSTIEILRLPLDKEEIGRVLGLVKPVGVLALEDKGFAASVQKLCRHDSKEEYPI